MSPLQFVWYLNIGATLVLVFRLALNGLIRVYRWLFLYMLADTLQQMVRLPFQFNENRSAEIYMVGQAAKTVIAVFVVLELYKLALAERPALAKFGRNTVGYVLAGAAVIALGGLILDPSVPPVSSKILYHFYSFERTMDVWVLIFLLLISLFMTWFPVRMKRNVAFYIGGFVVFFFARFIHLLRAMKALELGRFDLPLWDGFNIAVLSVSFGCLLVWVFALRRKGEESSTVIGHRWNPVAMEHLTGQLDVINTGLARLSRRKLK